HIDIFSYTGQIVSAFGPRAIIRAYSLIDVDILIDVQTLTAPSIQERILIITIDGSVQVHLLKIYRPQSRYSGMARISCTIEHNIQRFLAIFIDDPFIQIIDIICKKDWDRCDHDVVIALLHAFDDESLSLPIRCIYGNDC